MSTCIICALENEATAIEHIVPESFGNKHYVMKQGSICNECNNRMSESEGKALSNSIFLMERARLGIATKKGKAPKGSVEELKIEGDATFRKGIVNISGLNNQNVTAFDPSTGVMKLLVQSFDKSEVATSRMILKIGIESLYTSRHAVYEKYNFSDLKNYLSNKSNTDWGFITAKSEIGQFTSVPKFTAKYNLSNIRCILKYQEKSTTELIFKFQYGAVSLLINLLNRNLDWVSDYKAQEEFANIYPAHLERQFIKKHSHK
jgi:hypothetical protein